MSRLALALFLLSVPLMAQFDTATVLGTIKDQSENVIPAAKVSLLNLQDGTQQSATTDGEGNYQFLKFASASTA